METILITGARAPVALELARSFYKQGHRVIMADSLRLPIARWSNAVSQYVVLPSPKFSPVQFVEKVQEIISREHITHIIPTCEETFYFALYREKFSCKLWCSDIGLMDRLHNKFEFTRFAADAFSIPETCLLTALTDWNNSDQYVFKPIYSRFAASVILGKKIPETFFTASEKEKWIVQKRIHGKEICFYSIWDNGRLKAFASYHPLYRVGNGAGIYFEKFETPKAFELISAFGKKIKYTGQLSFDAIVDDTNEPYFIECNPRGTSGAHLINSGLADAFLNPETMARQDEKNFSIKYAIALLKPLHLFKKRIRKSKDIIFNSRDILPAFLQLLSVAEITGIKLKHKTSWLKATTRDIEWNGENNINPSGENI